MKIEYRSPTLSEYNELRGLVGWWSTDENSTGTALKNSLFSVVAVDQNTIIGFGRVIGDGGLYFYIQDLIIHPKFRNIGIGKALLKELMGYITVNAKSGAFVGLMAAKGLEKYYESFGFKIRDGDAPGMYQIIN
jgi:ribosomal protein S18 acetylase RimI-like enzyme